MRRVLASPFAAALIGGAVVAGAMLIAGVGDVTNRMIVKETSTPAAAVGPSAGGKGQLTPAEIFKRDAPGVVYITATVVEQTQSPFDLYPSTTRGTSSGTGFVINRSGTILTNAHVISGAVKITVAFAGNQTVTAQVIGRDPDDDLALLRVNPDGIPLVPLPLGDSDTVAVGDPTYAIGNPFGLPRSFTSGIVSAVQRSIRAPNKFSIDNVLQTDAPLNPGNSGGPLINAQGEVIGINSQIATGGSSSNGSIGIGFAIPIDTARAVIPQIERTGHVAQGYLGITTTDVDAALASLHLAARSGALVQTVESGSPAARAGIRSGTLLTTLPDGVTEVYTGGDIIVSVDGRAVTSAAGLATAIIAHRPGTRVRLGIVRGHRHLTVAVRLASRPSSLASP
ncbi:MAG TPA: trypsin-like peptidase domain-containing protein [Solirubrobacteraceae bacterium]|jgi:S1-C subfamily serine protease|nr:trypsin-like peptidase domain-containing protein [Solirubrobacteraceae bacterium]